MHRRSRFESEAVNMSKIPGAGDPGISADVTVGLFTDGKHSSPRVNFKEKNEGRNESKCTMSTEKS